MTVNWPAAGNTDKIPYSVYTDPTQYQLELEKIWYGNHYSYVGLECEVPNIGDYKLSYIGERQVIVVRNETGISVLENRCKHRGVQFEVNQRGNKLRFVCPYHQWKYNLEGDLVIVPFEKGAKKNV